MVKSAWSEAFPFDVQPIVPQTTPYIVNVEKGKKYYWCSCGRSHIQPWCDGSHKSTGFLPVEYVPHDSGMLIFLYLSMIFLGVKALCACKHSHRAPIASPTQHFAVKLVQSPVKGLAQVFAITSAIGAVAALLLHQ